MTIELSKPVLALLVLFGIMLEARSEDKAPFTRPWPWQKAGELNETLVQNTLDYLREIYQETYTVCSTWNDHDRPNKVINYGEKLKLPDECDNVKICSSQVCIAFGRGSWLLSLLMNSAEYTLNMEANNLTLPKVTLLRVDNYEVTNNTGFNPEYDSTNSILASASKTMRTTFNIVDMDPSILINGIGFVNSTIKTDCSRRPDGVREIKIYTSSSFGVGCSHFSLCNQTTCLMYTSWTRSIASIIYRNTSHVVNRLIPFCATNQVGFLSKRSLRRLPYHESKDVGLRFNLPYYRYCGPGTDVAEADDAGGPMDEVDAACREHDLAYMLQIDPEIADMELLHSVHKTGSWLYPLFVVAMESKRYFEKITGYRYTSYLYYVEPDISTTTVHYFYYMSAYDSFNMTEPEAAIGRNLENRWVSLVDDAWRGYCYTKTYSSDEEVQKSGGPANNRNLQANSHQCNSADTGEEPGSEECGETTAATDEDPQYPIPPKNLLPCRVVINELATSNTVNNNQYIELTKVCPTEAPNFKRNRARSLKGYSLHVIENGSPPKLHLAASLNNHNLKEVKEAWKGKLHHTNYYFLVGLLEEETVQLRISSRNTIQSKIPAGNDGSFAVVLTYDTHDEALPIPTLTVRNVIAPDLTPEQMLYIKQTTQDVLLYGIKCDEGCEYLQSLWTKTNADESWYHKPISDVGLDETGQKIYASINRCTTSILPMQTEVWEESSPTPGSKNNCPIIVNAPFLFTLTRGSKLQSSARKITMNILHFFEEAARDPDLMSGNPIELTARSTALSMRTIYNIKQELQDSGALSTPSARKRPRHPRVMASFDEFDIAGVKNIIQGYYAQNKPPLINEVYKAVVDSYEGRKTFSLKVFRKLLKQLGFHYGRINLRDVILQRPDIVNKRWAFLEAMRENERKGKDMLPVVYTDETWIDPHARTGKAIVPMQGRISFREKLKYTYQKHKVSRGSRVIILHAAGPDGMIDDVMTVYPVGGSKVSADYHDNVDHVTYAAFMTKLFSTLRDKGPHIIVIDNAPYHSKSHAPKQSTRKAEMEAWLNQYDGDGTLSGRIPGNKYLKPQLWSQVLIVKDKIEHHLIDIEAQKYGHKILRLPPYQCEFNPIEYVWFDAKNYVRSLNTEQTTAGAKMYAEQYFLMYTAEKFNKHAQHTKRLREESWENEKLYDRFLDNFEPIIVPLDDHSTDESDEENENTSPNVYGSQNNNVYSMVHNDGLVEVEVDDDDDDTNTARRRLDNQD